MNSKLYAVVGEVRVSLDHGRTTYVRSAVVCETLIGMFAEQAALRARHARNIRVYDTSEAAVNTVGSPFFFAPRRRVGA